MHLLATASLAASFLERAGATFSRALAGWRLPVASERRSSPALGRPGRPRAARARRPRPLAPRRCLGERGRRRKGRALGPRDLLRKVHALWHPLTLASPALATTLAVLVFGGTCVRVGYSTERGGGVLEDPPCRPDQRGFSAPGGSSSPPPPRPERPPGCRSWPRPPAGLLRRPGP